MVANGPDTTAVKSSTRTPLSGPGIKLSLVDFAVDCRLLVVVVKSRRIDRDAAKRKKGNDVRYGRKPADGDWQQTESYCNPLPQGSGIYIRAENSITDWRSDCGRPPLRHRARGRRAPVSR